MISPVHTPSVPLTMTSLPESRKHPKSEQNKPVCTAPNLKYFLTVTMDRSDPVSMHLTFLSFLDPSWWVFFVSKRSRRVWTYCLAVQVSVNHSYSQLIRLILHLISLSDPTILCWCSLSSIVIFKQHIKKQYHRESVTHAGVGVGVGLRRSSLLKWSPIRQTVAEGALGSFFQTLSTEVQNQCLLDLNSTTNTLHLIFRRFQPTTAEHMLFSSPCEAVTN